MTVQRIKLPSGATPKKLGAHRVPTGAGKVHKSKLTLNDVGVAQRGTISWGYTYGVAPQTAQFIVSDLYADEMVKAINRTRGKLTLAMAGNNVDGELTELKFEGLSFAPRTPSDHTHDTITVVDDRWRWPNKNVYRTYNLVRKANDLFVFAGVTAAVRPTLHDARKYYVDWTIKQDEEGRPVAPFTALEIVIDILSNFLGYDIEDIDLKKAQESEYIPPNIVIMGQPCHQIIQRFLTQSNNNLYVNELGKLVITAERIPFGQREFDQQLRPALRGQVGGELYVVDRQAIRPTNILVSFEREFEVLLKFKEGERTSTSFVAKTEEDALIQLTKTKNVFVENVTTTVIDKQVGTLPRGTIVTIEQALEAFGRKYGSETITLDKFRENYGIAAPSVFHNVLADPANGIEFDPRAITAWTQITRDYRKVFRVPDKVLQFVKAMNNVGVDIINPQTGKRRPSEVFSIISWVIKVASRVMGKRSQGIFLDSFSNLKGGSSRFQPVPMLTSSVDMDFGTFTIEGLNDTNQPGSVLSVIRGRAVDDLFYNDQFGEGETDLDKNALFGAHGLKANWEMSTVVSATLLPKGSETVAFFDPDPPEDIPRGNGPPVEVHLNYDTVRIALDSFNTRQYRDKRDDPFVNRALIEAIANQESARRWVTFSDQIQGNVTFTLSEEAKKLRPQGPVSQVLFQFNGTSGAIRVSFSAAPISEGRDIENLVQNEVLEGVFRQVHFAERVGTR